MTRSEDTRNTSKAADNYARVTHLSDIIIKSILRPNVPTTSTCLQNHGSTNSPDSFWPRRTHSSRNRFHGGLLLVDYILAS
jgi:hypothetical protein